MIESVYVCTVCTRPMHAPGMACRGCEQKIDRNLREIPEMYALLPTLGYVERDTRRGTFTRIYWVREEGWRESTEQGPRDPVSNVLSGGPLHNGSNGPRVSGTSTPPVPADLTMVDLTLPARHGSRPLLSRGLLGLDQDQVGDLPVATVLDTLARDWATHSWCRGRLPQVPTVTVLAHWLRTHLRDACRHHAAIDEAAGEIKEQYWTLRNTLGLTRHIDRLPAPCPTCDTLALYREAGSAYVECGHCGRLWSEDEYQRLVVILAAELHDTTDAA